MARFGCCLSMPAARMGLAEAQLAAQAKAAGFDYAEVAISDLSALSPSEFGILCRALADSELPCTNTNSFFPDSFRLIGEHSNPSLTRDYCQKAFDRVCRLGVQCIGFGSGPSRSLDPGMPREEGFRQFSEVLFQIGSLAKSYGLTVLLEPLRFQESNHLNTLSECAQAIQAAALPNLGLLADFYHFTAVGDSLDALKLYRSHIRHLHIASPRGRLFPRMGDGIPYAPFFDMIRSTGEWDALSVEGFTADFPADAPAALTLMQNLMNEQQAD